MTILSFLVLHCIRAVEVALVSSEARTPTLNPSGISVLRFFFGE